MSILRRNESSTFLSHHVTISLKLDSDFTHQRTPATIIFKQSLQCNSLGNARFTRRASEANGFRRINLIGGRVENMRNTNRKLARNLIFAGFPRPDSASTRVRIDIRGGKEGGEINFDRTLYSRDRKGVVLDFVKVFRRIMEFEASSDYWRSLLLFQEARYNLFLYIFDAR